MWKIIGGFLLMIVIGGILFAVNKSSILKYPIVSGDNSSTKAVKVAEKDLDRIFASVVLTDADFDMYKKTNGHSEISTRAKNLMGDMRLALENGVGQDMGERGTAMWVYNGLTSYFQNNAKFRDEETKFDAIMQGRVQQKIYKAVQEMLCEV